MDEIKQKNISFAEFELDRNHRRLLRNGEPVRIYAKAFDLLNFLIENRGRILSKDEILEAVWEGQIVEEANLSVQISALRKALGETAGSPKFLITIPGRGYKFIAEIKFEEESPKKPKSLKSQNNSRADYFGENRLAEKTLQTDSSGNMSDGAGVENAEALPPSAKKSFPLPIWLFSHRYNGGCSGRFNGFLFYQYWKSILEISGK